MQRKWLFAAPVVALMAIKAYADLEGSSLLPLDHPAIQYAKLPLHDPASALMEQIRAGKVKLAYDEEFGYLPSVLKQLDVPISSQVLVFSKTSFQAARISPRMPRAIYFNDRVTVGWVKGGDVVEIAAADPQQGTVFYTIDQDRTAAPRVDRRDECLQCHQSGGTLGVPGLVVRSVYPDTTGMPLFHAGTFTTDHRSPLKERWGGWYVTGSHGRQTHMGNVMSSSRETPELDFSLGANITDLKSKFDTGAYLSPHSDITALMVLEHQTRMQNLITRVGYETRMALHQQKGMNEALHQPADEMSDSTKRRINNPAEVLLQYMLFTDEALLDEPVKGTSAFTSDFAKQGPRDRRGRSLRDFDLTRRMFRYPCSYLIYSDAFDGLPDVVKQQIYRRLYDVLSGKDQSKAYVRLTAEDRQAVLEILRETKKGLPEYWK